MCSAGVTSVQTFIFLLFWGVNIIVNRLYRDVFYHLHFCVCVSIREIVVQSEFQKIQLDTRQSLL